MEKFGFGIRGKHRGPATLFIRCTGPDPLTQNYGSACSHNSRSGCWDIGIRNSPVMVCNRTISESLYGTGISCKGTVQRELRGVKIGRSIMMSSLAGKCSLPCPKGHHHERNINVFSGCSTF